MGKVRVKTLGVEEVEEKEKKELKKRKEQKRTSKAPGLKGGERVVAVGPTEEELAQLEVPRVSEVPPASPAGRQVSQGERVTPRDTRKPRGTSKKRIRSKSYRSVAKLVDRSKTYPLSEGIDLLEKLKTAKFDETVELHVNTLEKGISVTVALPHGTGKKIRVEIADPADSKIDNLLKKLSAGTVDFDVLIASPSAMPKLASVAKILGPRGLMPNPKSGTISDKPKEVAKKYENGQVVIKTEGKAPVIHLDVGKLSFGKEKLLKNIKTALGAVKTEKIKNVTLKSTMSPGIRIQLD